MQDFSQTTNADGTKLDMRDDDHSLYALMGCFCIRSTASVQFFRDSLGWLVERSFWLEFKKLHKVSVHTAGSAISRKRQLLMISNLVCRTRVTVSIL